MKRTSREGFTLIELIVTIVILGVLAALAVPAFSAVIERSRQNTTIQSANAVARNVHAFAAFDGADSVYDAIDADGDGTIDDAALASDVNDGVLDASAKTITITEGDYSVTVDLDVPAGQHEVIDSVD